MGSPKDDDSDAGLWKRRTDKLKDEKKDDKDDKNNKDDENKDDLEYIKTVLDDEGYNDFDNSTDNLDKKFDVVLDPKLIEKTIDEIAPDH